MSDLDKIFKDFEDRKRREQEANEHKGSKELQLRKKTIKVLSEIVLPVLREQSAAISKKAMNRPSLRDWKTTFTRALNSPSGQRLRIATGMCSSLNQI